MVTNAVSAVIFAKDLQRVASFYREVFGADVLRRDSEREVLSCPPWATGDGSFFLGYDPEGNVIGVMPANK